MWWLGHKSQYLLHVLARLHAVCKYKDLHYEEAEKQGSEGDGVPSVQVGANSIAG